MLLRALPFLALATPLGAQSPTAVPAARYPLAPSPVLDTRQLGTAPSFSGYLSVRETRRHDSTSFSLNRARLAVMAAPRPYLAVRVQAELSAAGRVARDSTVPSTVLTDAYVQLGAATRASGAAGVDSAGRGARLANALAPVLLAGQFRVPFSLEYLTSFSLLKTANRSGVVDRLSPRRDIGVMAQARVTRFATVAGAVVAGEGANATRNPDNSEMVAGRLTLRPARALAVAVKWAGQGPDHLWGYDARWLQGRATVEGEALHRTGRRPGATAAPAPTPRYAAGGGYLLAAYKVTPWLEPVAKWERFSEDATVGERETAFTAGATAHAGDERVRFQLNLVSRHTRASAAGAPRVHANELIAQLIASY